MIKVVIEKKAQKQIDAIKNKINPYEMGGIVFGSITKDARTYNITELVGMLPDDISEINNFYRNSCKKYNEIITKKWEKSKGVVNYLGDWHTHNEKVPHPSDIDKNTLQSIQKNSPEIDLINLIIGLSDICIMTLEGDIIQCQK